MDKKLGNDWRLDGYDGYLNEATFALEKFLTVDNNDHEHCVFCWQKITDLNIEGSDKEGYCTKCEETGQTQWVCKDCFNEFKNLFNFKVK